MRCLSWADCKRYTNQKKMAPGWSSSLGQFTDLQILMNLIWWGSTLPTISRINFKEEYSIWFINKLILIILFCWWGYHWEKSDIGSRSTFSHAFPFPKLLFSAYHFHIAEFSPFSQFHAFASTPSFWFDVFASIRSFHSHVFATIRSLHFHVDS